MDATRWISMYVDDAWSRPVEMAGYGRGCLAETVLRLRDADGRRGGPVAGEAPSAETPREVLTGDSGRLGGRRGGCWREARCGVAIWLSVRSSRLGGYRGCLPVGLLRVYRLATWLAGIVLLYERVCMQ